MKITESVSGWRISDFFTKITKDLNIIAKESKKYHSKGLETAIEDKLMYFLENLPNGDYNDFIYSWKKLRGYI